MSHADYRKHNDRSQSSSTYHKKDGTAVRQILKREAETEAAEALDILDATVRLDVLDAEWIIELLGEDMNTCECEGCKDLRSDAEDYRLSGGRDWETDSIYGDAN